MPNIKSAAKRMRQSRLFRARNMAVRSEITSTRRKLFEAVDAKNAVLASQLYPTYCSLLDRAAKKGVIKDNTAARRKRRAAAKVKSVPAAA